MQGIISFPFLVAIVAAAAAALGCSHDNATPITPDQGSLEVSPGKVAVQTHLWAYTDVYVDIPTKTARAVPSRDAMFAANVVQFLNGNPANLKFKINGTLAGDGYIDVDIDVEITHPFAGMPQYNGYDVRGIFIGNGSDTLEYNPNLEYAAFDSTDQAMYDFGDLAGDPHPGEAGNPDGYTRWWNPCEFTAPGLFGYTKGVFASPNYSATATLNPYKYFADGLDVEDDLWTFLTGTSDDGVFSAGASNTRNYYLRFPVPNPNVKFAYGVLANWKGTKVQDHPANAPEACGLSVVVTPSLYYVSSSEKGGKLILDMSFFRTWGEVPSKIYIESTVLANPYLLSASEMIPVGGGGSYSTYHVEIAPDNLTSNSETEHHEFWVIPQYDEYNYVNDFGVGNLAGNDELAAFFRRDLPVLNDHPPLIENVIDDLPPPDTLNPVVDNMATAVTYTVNFTDADPSQSHIIHWYIENVSATGPSDPPDGMPYNWSLKPPGDYKIWVTVDDGYLKTQGGPYDVKKVEGWAVTWGGTDTDYAYSAAVDQSGNIYVAGSFRGYADFDPSPSGVDGHTSNGSFDIYLSKFGSDGTFLWATTWGGALLDEGYSVALDSSGNPFVTGATDGQRNIFLYKFDPDGSLIWLQTWGGAIEYGFSGQSVAVDSSNDVYVTGYFNGAIDFDPGSGVDIHSPLGSADIFISKFTSNGTFVWARTWGGILSEWGLSVAVGPTSGLYVAGYFSGTVDFDPNPSGTDWHYGTGGGNYDCFLSKFDLNGNFTWARTWGGVLEDESLSVDVDSSGNPYVAGYYCSTMADFDPSSGGVDYHSSNGGQDIFLSKFDTGGSFAWARTWGGLDSDYGYSTSLDSSGNAYVTGYFRDTVDFDPSPGGVDNRTSNGWGDVFVSRFGSDGALTWVQTWGGSSGDSGRAVANDASGCPYITGYFGGTVDFDPSPGGLDYHTSAGSADEFLSKLTPGGLW